jgi:hypothetical protein
MKHVYPLLSRFAPLDAHSTSDNMPTPESAAMQPSHSASNATKDKDTGTKGRSRFKTMLAKLGSGGHSKDKAKVG